MRETHLAAGRCAGALALSLGLLAPGAAAQTRTGGGGGATSPRRRSPRSTCVRRCASKSRAQGGSTIKLDRLGPRPAAKVVFSGSYGQRRRPDRARCARARDTRALRARAGRRGDRAGHGRDRRAGAVRSRPRRSRSCLRPRPPRTPVLSPVPGLHDDGAARRDRHQPHARLRGRAPRGDLLLPGHRRARPRRPTVELVRASDGAAVKTWAPGRRRPGRGAERLLGRPARRAARPSRAATRSA